MSDHLRRAPLHPAGYYAEDDDGVTCIQGSGWRLP